MHKIFDRLFCHPILPHTQPLFQLNGKALKMNAKSIKVTILYPDKWEKVALSNQPILHNL